MPYYCMNLNAQTNGDHEVHDKNCTRAPEPKNQRDLGYHATCHTAVAQAKIINSLADGCYYCSPACHKR